MITKVFLICISLLSVYSDNEAEWIAFKNKYGKTYQDSTEDARRQSIFIENQKIVKAHNEKFAAGLQPTQLSIEKLLDLSAEEYVGCYIDSIWRDYKTEFDKEYRDPTEDAKRKEIFRKNYITIEKHNRRFDLDEVDYKTSPYMLSDYTFQEILEMTFN